MLSAYSTEKSIAYIAAPALPVKSVSSGIQISWSAVDGAERYNVYRKSGSGSFAYVGNSTGTSYTDTKVASGTSYTYRVAVVSADGKSMLSAYSAEKTITAN
jgi:fibronectin type 3 domain-containing protein